MIQKIHNSQLANTLLGHVFGFDGCDGVGKSTLIQNLKQHFLTSGYEVTVIKSPSYEVFEFIKSNNPDPVIQTHLLLDDCLRLSHQIKRVYPGPRSIIFLDRWAIYTARAYQMALTTGYQQGQVLDALNEALLNPDKDFVIPQKYFVLTCDPEIAYKRKTNENMTDDSLDFHNKVNNNFKLNLQYFPVVCYIDANKSEQTVFNEVLNEIIS